MSKRLTMPEEKSKRIAVGATVGGVLLVIVLVVIIVIQFVQMGVRQRKLNEIKAAEEALQQAIDGGMHNLDYYESWFGKYSAALKQGWRFPD